MMKRSVSKSELQNPNDEPMELIAIGYPPSFQLNGMWEKLRS